MARQARIRTAPALPEPDPATLKRLIEDAAAHGIVPTARDAQGRSLEAKRGRLALSLRLTESATSAELVYRAEDGDDLILLLEEQASNRRWFVRRGEIQDDQWDRAIPSRTGIPAHEFVRLPEPNSGEAVFQTICRAFLSLPDL